MNVVSEKKLERMKKILASKEHPFMCCTTCGRTTDKLIVRTSPTLRSSPNAKKQKTWRRTVKKHDYKKVEYNRQKVASKIIYFSYQMLDCIGKRHKLSIRRAPFSTKLVTELV